MPSLEINICDKLGFTALDLATVFGHYNCALAIHQAGLAFKSIEFYQTRRNIFAGKEIDFERFIHSIKKGVDLPPLEANLTFFVEKQMEREVVVDPNESWGEFFRSVILLEDAKVVPVSSLSSTDLG